jgi:hypothetical protein
MKTTLHPGQVTGIPVETVLQAFVRRQSLRGFCSVSDRYCHAQAHMRTLLGGIGLELDEEDETFQTEFHPPGSKH